MRIFEAYFYTIIKLYNKSLYFSPVIVWVYVCGNFSGEFRKKIMQQWRLCRSRSSKVIDFGANWKRVCEFLLVECVAVSLVLFCNVSEILQFASLVCAHNHMAHPHCTLFFGLFQGGYLKSLVCCRWTRSIPKYHNMWPPEDASWN